MNPQNGEIATPPFSANARIEAMILILDVFEKKTSKTPKSIVDVCKRRIKTYEKDIKG